MSSDPELTSQRPYLLRAMHEWMSDNALTPHIVVDATAEGLRVPPGHVSDGRITLNISYSATRSLVIGNEVVAFEARFGGVPFQVSIPVEALLGVYARENGQGLVFAAEESPPPPDGPGDGKPKAGPERPGPARGERPSLKVVK